jgi:DNA repair photolyase
MHMPRAAFCSAVAPAKDALKRLEADCKTVYDEPIFFSFISDIYQPFPPGIDITREAIQIVKRSGNRLRILTKGGPLARRDFDLLTPDDELGATLTFDFADDSRVWEPNAAKPWERMATLITAKNHGIKTWASFEPVIDPMQTLSMIQVMAPYLDVIKVGKLNHPEKVDWPSEDWKERVLRIDWADFAVEVKALLEETGKPYLIKSDLATYLPDEARVTE